MKPFVTFIIPTIGRESLRDSLRSLLIQTDDDWNALVIGDKVRTDLLTVLAVTLSHDERILFRNLPEKLGHDNVAAEVRNIGFVSADGEWIASLDDDDTLDEHYIEWLRQESNELDLIQFRAELENGVDIRPAQREDKWEKYKLAADTVSNAFAFRLAFAREHQLRFKDGTSEDWATIEAFLILGARARLSERVAYRVRH